MITWSDLGNGFWLWGFLFVVSLLVYLPVYCIARIWVNSFTIAERSKRIIGTGLLSGISLGFAGIVAGFLTGSSRAPAVSALVPAVLTFVGLVVVYLIGKSVLRSTLAGFIVFVFSANLLVGTVIGSASRDRHEEYVQSPQFLKLKADQEFAVRQYRRALGLPLDAPKKDQTETSSDTKQ
jgi:hypothetical protein